MSRPRRIGITGGIGSGKSFVSRILQQRCLVPVYDCDSEAKRLMTNDSRLRQALTELVGSQTYDSEGQLNRSVVAAFLFANAANAARVNALVHPAVKSHFDHWANAQQTDVVGVESAILVESGMDCLVDDILFVDASEQTRLQRAMQRDGVSALQIRARMRQQRTEEARSRATWVIKNETNETEESIYNQIKEKNVC